MKNNLRITAILGAIAVLLGAWAAHGLKKILTPEDVVSFQTGVRYQMIHVLALLFVNMYKNFSVRTKNFISNFFYLGILCFSGSIYFLKLTSMPMPKVFYLVTPLGGLCFVAGWIAMAVKFRR